MESYPDVSLDDDAFVARASEALGFHPTELHPAHDPVEDSVVAILDASRTRFEIRYVAIDPFPPRSFWPEDGSRGRLVPVEPKAAGFPVRVDAAGVRETQTSEEATHLYVSPPGIDRNARARNLRGFEAWRNGDAYGFVVETYAVDEAARTLTSISVEATWGCLDLEAAGEAMQAGAGDASGFVPGFR